MRGAAALTRPSLPLTSTASPPKPAHSCIPSHFRPAFALSYSSTFRYREVREDELLQSRTSRWSPASTICSSRLPSARISSGWLSSSRIPSGWLSSSTVSPAV